MDIKDQVLSREQMAHLVELGVDTSDASMCWVQTPNDDLWSVEINDHFRHSFMLCFHPDRYVPTYTIGDLIKKLPKRTGDDHDSTALDISFYEHCVLYCERNRYDTFRCDFHCSLDDMSLIDALYYTLCWITEAHGRLIK